MSIFFIFIQNAFSASAIDCITNTGQQNIISNPKLYEDDDSIYFEYKNIAFGVSIKSDNGFIKINKTLVNVGDIFFTQKSKPTKIKGDDISMREAELYFVKNKNSYYCIDAHFSGAGKSGNMQKQHVWIYIPMKTKNPDEINGLIVN